MNYRLFLIWLLLFLPISIFSKAPEDDDLSEIAKQEKKFFIAHAKISINNVFLDGTNYIETKISPFLKIERFYLGLDFSLKIDTVNGGILNTFTYLKPRNYFQFVNSFGYSTANDIFEIQVGTITNLSWGEGLLLSHFRNDLFLPDIRQLGILLNLRYNPYIGIEFFSSDIQNFGLGGFSLYSSPLAFLEHSNPLSKTKIAAQFLYDVDTEHILYEKPDIINWGINPKSSKRYAYSLSARFPLWGDEKKDILLGVALEQGGIISSSQYAGLGKFFFHYKAYQMSVGLAYLDNGFHLNFFSPLYTQPSIRSSRPEEGKGQNALGYMLENELSFFNTLLTFHFNIYGQTNPFLSLDTAFEIKPYLLKQLSILFGYIAEDGNSFESLFYPPGRRANTFILTRISYLFADRATLGFFYRRALHIEADNTNLYSRDEISVQVSLIF